MAKDFNALCEDVLAYQTELAGSNTLSVEGRASMVQYYTMFRYSLEDFTRLYREHYLPSARAASAALKEAFDVSPFKGKLAFTESYFNKAHQEKLQEGYVSLYHRVESLIVHLDYHFKGERYGGLLADTSQQTKESIFNYLKEWGLSKELLYKSSKSITPPNYLINRLRIIANDIKHGGAVATQDSESVQKLELPLDDEYKYILNERVFFNDIAAINFYCRLVFTVAFSLSLQKTLDESIFIYNQLENKTASDEIEIIDLNTESNKNIASISLMVDAIRSTNERDFLEKLIALGMAEKSSVTEPDELYLWLPNQD